MQRGRGFTGKMHAAPDVDRKLVYRGLSAIRQKARVDFSPLKRTVTLPLPVRPSTVPIPLSVSHPIAASPRRLATGLLGLFVSSWSGAGAASDGTAAATTFHRDIKPILAKYCYDCHGDGSAKGQVSFDEFASDAELLSKHGLWEKAMRNMRAGLMPPREEGDDKFRPTAEEVSKVSNWVKFQALGLDPANPDPGAVTVRRLNRVEYRNTIRDLMGFDFNSEAEFPPDDTGNGFDNNGDVLTISPLLLEKYLDAAEVIVDRAIPKVSHVIKERSATARDFRTADGRSMEVLSSKREAKVSRTFQVEQDETYQLILDLDIRGSFDFDPARCQLTCFVDGQQQFTEEIVWHERKTLRREYAVKWKAGEHVVEFQVEPLTPVATPVLEPRRPDPVVAANSTPPVAPTTLAGNAPNAPVAPAVTTPATAANAAVGAVAALGEAAATPASLRLPSVAATTAARLDVRINTVQVNGPIDRKFWVAPENHARFFPNGAAPADPVARDQYASEVLRRFATRAFRRPVDDAKVAQLTRIARASYTQPGKTFEEGIGRAVMAVLASPRFLFRVEEPVATAAKDKFVVVDDYTLAQRLSYFLWSTMPDEELSQLAARGELRQQLRPQVARMLKDSRSQALVKDFTGQWLQARDVESVPINARAVLGIGAPRRGAGGARIEFDGPLRRLMRSETEMYFEHVLREDRSALELIESDYTFLNERLASHYGVTDVTGPELRLVKLPADSPRGGILTQGTVLAVTSNPTRTSPVKRGMFVLENILGTPPPPPPPDVPDLEEAAKEFKDKEPKLSEMLALHRANALCASCHERMDPLGLAFENFNAMGNWRDTEAKQPIDPAGKLATGEKFANVRELKRVLVTDRRADFYRCLTEKLLTYALGRGLEGYDTHTIDQIVEKLEREQGRMSVLLFGVIDSAPFQKMRARSPDTAPIKLTSHVQP